MVEPSLMVKKDGMILELLNKEYKLTHIAAVFDEKLKDS